MKYTHSKGYGAPHTAKGAAKQEHQCEVVGGEDGQVHTLARAHKDEGGGQGLVVEHEKDVGRGAKKAVKSHHKEECKGQRASTERGLSGQARAPARVGLRALKQTQTAQTNRSKGTELW